MALVVIVSVTLLIFSPSPEPFLEDTSSDVATSTATSADETIDVVTPGSKEVTLALQEKASYNDIAIQPASIIEESRCPKSLTCIQAGRVRISLNILSLEGEHILSKVLEEGAFFYAGSTKVTLVKVTPFPVDSVKIADKDYRFEFLLEVVE